MPRCAAPSTSPRSEMDEDLDLVQPIVVIRHPARGQFPAVVELQVREARLP